MRFAVAVVPALAALVFACKSPTYHRAVEDAAVGDPAAAAEAFRKDLAAGDLYMASHALDDVPSDRVKDVARLVEGNVVAVWPAIEAKERDFAKTLGVDRARGKSRDNCLQCTRFRVTLDQLAAQSPAIAAKWSALKPQLDAAERAAYDAEHADARPLVTVTVTDDSVLVATCAVDALRARFTDYRWDVGGDAGAAPAIELRSDAAVQHYGNAAGKHAALISGLAISLVPHNLDAKLAKHFAKPVESHADVGAPDRLGDSLTPGDLAAVQVGTGKLDEITAAICADLAPKIQKL